jgi:hypothetical protein
LKLRGYEVSKLSNFVKTTEKSTKQLKVMPPPPPYFSNGDKLGEFFHTIRFRTFQIRGCTTSKSPKKNTIKSKCPCNPKTLNLLYLPNPTFLGKIKHTTSFKTLENGG